MAIFPLQPDLACEHLRIHIETSANAFRHGFRVPGIEQNDVAADFTFQFAGSSESHQLSFVEDGQTVAALRLFHQVRGYNHGDFFFVPQNLEVLPQVAARAGIKTRCRFIEQKNSRMVEQAFCQFQPALHPARKCFSFFVGAIRQPYSGQHFRDARFQRRPTQSIEMALVPQVFSSSQFQVNALGLEHNPDLTA